MRVRRGTIRPFQRLSYDETARVAAQELHRAFAETKRRPVYRRRPQQLIVDVQGQTDRATIAKRMRSLAAAIARSPRMRPLYMPQGVRGGLVRSREIILRHIVAYSIIEDVTFQRFDVLLGR